MKRGTFLVFCNLRSGPGMLFTKGNEEPDLRLGFFSHFGLGRLLLGLKPEESLTN